MKCAYEGICEIVCENEGLNQKCDPCVLSRYLTGVCNGFFGIKKDTADLLNDLIGEVLVQETSFLCPHLEIKMLTNCTVTSCKFYTDLPRTQNCIVAYAKKNSNGILNNAELSLFTGIPVHEVRKTLDDGVNSLRKRNIINVLQEHRGKYCAKCGRISSLIEVDGTFVCENECEPETRKNILTVEQEFGAPASIVVRTILKTYNRMAIAIKLTRLNRNEVKRIMQTYYGMSVEEYVPMNASKSRERRLRRRTHHYPKKIEKWIESFGVSLTKDFTATRRELNDLIRREKQP